MSENSTSGRSETSRQILDAIAMLEAFENMEIHVRLNADAVVLTGTASEGFKKAAGLTAMVVIGEVGKIINNIVTPSQGTSERSGGCGEDEKECYCNGNVNCIPISRPCPDCDG